MNVREKIVYYLSRRNHSEKELAQKLRLKKYSSSEIQEGIKWAIDIGYITPPDQTSEAMARSLHRKNKGILYINQYLKAKGLPPQSTDWELELKKAYAVCSKNFQNPPYTFDQKQDIYKLLARRGFLDRTIQDICSLKSQPEF